MIPPKFKGKSACALYSIVCHSVLYYLTSVLFATKLCFIFLCMAIKHTLCGEGTNTGLDYLTGTLEWTTALTHLWHSLVSLIINLTL